MLIKSEFDIQFNIPQPTAMVAMLHLHPSLAASVVGEDRVRVEHTGETETVSVPVEDYLDSFGNRCTRFVAPAGKLKLTGDNVTRSDDFPELQGFGLEQTPVHELPVETLRFLLASRYCEVDRFNAVAQDLFGHMGQGWALAAAVRDWVHEKVAFNYKTARSTKTAMDVYTERVGVCRDFQHLAITLTRCLNIPARYVTGYIGDIRVPYSGPGDFSAWYQVWLGGKWWDMDARHNYARTGRILMAAGRDAADVAITTSFGVANLTHFSVESNEMDDAGNLVYAQGSPQTLNMMLPAA